MSRNEIIENYMQEYNKIRAYAKNLNYTEAEIDECFQESLKSLNIKKKLNYTTFAYIFSTTLVILLLIYILLYAHQPTSSLVLQNVQGFIYPGFQVLRSLAIPIISLFPRLTALYDETCLIENPYFQVANLDCYPCEHVHSVINLTGLTLNHSNFSIYETGTPFVIAGKRPPVTFDDIETLYKENKKDFDDNAPWMITTNNASYIQISQVFGEELNRYVYVHWRINRMLPARILRKLFPRPAFISEWSGQSIERYLLLDGAQSPGYKLPGFECGYIFILQGSGERDIILEATEECKESCRCISVRMKPSYILWYNWWYWKPVSLPAANATSPSIAYISSYC